MRLVHVCKRTSKLAVGFTFNDQIKGKDEDWWTERMSKLAVGFTFSDQIKGKDEDWWAERMSKLALASSSTIT